MTYEEQFKESIKQIDQAQKDLIAAENLHDKSFLKLVPPILTSALSIGYKQLLIEVIAVTSTHLYETTVFHKHSEHQWFEVKEGDFSFFNWRPSIKYLHQLTKILSVKITTKMIKEDAEELIREGKVEMSKHSGQQGSEIVEYRLTLEGEKLSKIAKITKKDNS